MHYQTRPPSNISYLATACCCDGVGWRIGVGVKRCITSMAIQQYILSSNSLLLWSGEQGQGVGVWGQCMRWGGEQAEGEVGSGMRVEWGIRVGGFELYCQKAAMHSIFPNDSLLLWRWGVGWRVAGEWGQCIGVGVWSRLYCQQGHHQSCYIEAFCHTIIPRDIIGMISICQQQ